MHSVSHGKRNQLYFQGAFVGKGIRQEAMLGLSLKEGSFQEKKMRKESVEVWG